MRPKTGIFALGLLFFSLTTVMYAQQPPFTKVFYDLSGTAQSYSIVKTFDHNFMIAGEKDDVPMMMKVDPAGNALWIKKAEATVPQSRFTSVIATSDSCFVFAGTVPPWYGDQVLCMKMSPAGNPLWFREYNLGMQVITSSIQETSGHGFILTGDLKTPVATSEVFVLKLDSAGNISWSTILSSLTGSDFGYAVKQTPDGGYILAGETESYPPYQDGATMIKLTASGAVSWAKKQNVPAQYYSSAWDVVVTATGLIWYLSTTGNGVVLMKTDVDGNVLWSKSITATPGGVFDGTPRPKLHVTSDGGFVFLSSSQGFDQLVRTDADGNSRWGQTFWMITYDVAEADDNGYMVAGNGPIMGVKKSPTNNPQIGLVKTDSAGNSIGCESQITVTSAPCSISFTPITFTSSSAGSATSLNWGFTNVSLSVFEGCVPITGSVSENNEEVHAFAVSPNPASGRFLVTNTRPSGLPILDIRVFNAFGRMVRESSVQVSDQARFDLEGQPDGLYFVQARYADRIYTEKIVINH